MPHPDRLHFSRHAERRTSDEKLLDQLEFIALSALDNGTGRGRGWAYEIGGITATDSGLDWTFKSWIKFYRDRPASPIPDRAARLESEQREIIYQFAAAAGHHRRFSVNPWIADLKEAQREQEKKKINIATWGDIIGGLDADQEAKQTTVIDPIADSDPIPLSSISSIQPGDYYSHLFGLDAQIRILLSAIQAAADSDMRNRFHSLLHGKPGCLSADTDIRYTVISKEGKKQNCKGGTIENLFYRFNKIERFGKGYYQHKETVESEFFVPSCTENNKIKLNKVLGVVDSGVKPVYFVLTKSNRYIKATTDHKFFRPDGSYSMLSELSPGDCIMVHPGKPQYRGGKRRVYTKEILVKQHPRGRIKKIQKYIYYRVYIHNAVIEADRNGMSFDDYITFLNSCTKEEADKLWTVPKESHIHHIDGNHNNNNIDNLKILNSRSEHTIEYHIENSLENISIIAEEDSIVDIVYKGMNQTYDIMVEAPYHNFSANGFIVHNSGKTDTLLSTHHLLTSLGISCLAIDATSTTEAGMRKLLLDEDEILPEVILVEEIEKALHSFRLLLGIMDDRGTVSEMNYRRTSSRKVPALILASANDYALLQKIDSGALLSRFSNEIECPLPDRDICAKILEREINLVKNGNLAWIEPTLIFCCDERGIFDPRQLKRICLSGKDRLLTGEYQLDLEVTMRGKKSSIGNANLDLFR